MISIPDPCGEDFSKMTQTEKGAFCKVCSTDTYDFRKLTSNQVFEVLEENENKHICGRFTVGQLENLNRIGFANWKNQSTRTFQSKFLLACVMVFGLTLFSCENENASEIENIQVEQVINDMEPQIAHINKHADLEILDIDLMDYVVLEVPELDGIGCEYPMDVHVAGGLMYEPYDVVEPPKYDDHVLGGAIAYTTEIDMISVVKIEDIEEKEPILSEQELKDPRVFVATAFPNPTQNQSTIALDIENEGQFDIMMYDMNGSLVTNIHSGHLVEGRQTFEVDMYDLNSGLYIVKVISQGQNETLKIQKVN